MNCPPTIIYCGALWEGSTSRMRLDALRALGHRVISVDTTPVAGRLVSIATRVLGRLGHHVDDAGANVKLLAHLEQTKAPLVWIDKGLTIRPRTLALARALVPTTMLLHYSLDDMSGRHNQSRQYRASIPLYDLHVTNKSYNVAELTSLGARSVLFVNNAYCERTHTPKHVTLEDRRQLGGAVGFIGAFERDRAEAISALIAEGISVRIWGGWGKGWHQWAKTRTSMHLVVEDRGLFGEDYAKALCSFDINLGFLRKLNRDLQTTRSVEIPACGAFMLAERTSEHSAMFAEGLEAEYFESHNELIRKAKYYLMNPDERLRIAAAGRKRCVDTEYSYTAQAKRIISHVSTVTRRTT